MGNFDRKWSFSRIFKMDVTIWFSVLLAVITLGTPASSSEPRVVCYYTNWSVYRPGTARFNPQNINPYLCTHLIYAFGGFTKDNTLKPFDKYQDIEKGGYAKFTGLKTYNKELKTLLAIGGWNEGSSRFSPMVASRERRKEFVRNAIKFLRQNRFDGLDLDWEYPAFRDGGKPKDREHYAKLVKELREEFERESQKTGKPRLLLTMAVPAGIEYIEKGFDVKTLNQYLDWMNLLTYDYHSAFEPAVNHHAPLYPLEEPNEYSVDNELNIDYTIKFYLENGADADKLVLGIPTYGRSYTLFNPDAVEIGSPADGPGDQGDATREKGYLAYYEICEALIPKEKKKRSQSEEDSEEYEDEEEEPIWTVMYPNPEAMGPVAYKGNQWVGYDDVDIVKKKAHYVAENGLGGIMFWSIDNDDFRGVCHEKPYPLIEAAKEAYYEGLGSTTVVKKTKPAASRPTTSRKKTRPRSSSTTTTTERTTKASKRVSSTTPSWNVTPEPPTTPDPGADFKCVDEGFYPHPRDCKKYFWCLDSGPSNLGIVAHQFTCPSGLYFNKAADSCDFARNVPCKKSAATTKAPTTKPATTKTPSTTTTTTTTTTRRPIRLSTKSTSMFRTTRTTSTTTPKPEPEEEYEEEVVEDGTDVDAEDPKVIKELIDLIKKVGGIEQLEKQLGLGESSVSTGGAVTTTPASFNKKLYQKVLERTRGRNKNNSILEIAAQNIRRGPQNAGLEATNDRDKLLKRDRPQYTTINRQRSPSTTEAPIDAEESDEEEEEEVAPVAKVRTIESRPGVATTPKPLQYVNIRRGRPTTETLDNADDSGFRNALYDRTEALVSVSDAPESFNIATLRRENIPEYVTIRRQRPTTEETTTVQYQNDDEEDTIRETALEREISTQPQYSTIVRSRSTNAPEETNTAAPINRVRSTILPTEDPTTVLDVQISSLLNSPSTSELDIPETEPPVIATEIADPPTTTTTTTTSSPSTRRINIIRRRGSTTTAAPAPSTTSQVSLRNYTSVRRRRPLSRPNEINSDSDNGIDLSRKIRSTTPDSREVDSATVTRSSRARSRYNRLQASQVRNDDSVPAAASPVLRGQSGPDNLNVNEPIISKPDVTPLFGSRQSSRFQGRIRKQNPPVAVSSDAVPDSEVSAATVETSRPNLLPRGRSRFSLNTASDTTAQSITSAPVAQRRPTFGRFSPRPFTRSTPPPTTLDTIEETSADVTTQRIASRLTFGRTRATAAVAARKLPFATQVPLTTPAKSDYEDDDGYTDVRSDDILLSESAREEKEHFDSETTTEAEAFRQRVVIKKLRPLTTADGELISTETIPIDDSGRKRFRVIRRKPTTSTISPETVAPTEIPTGPQRIRKVIRKKLRPAEEEPEITAKSVGSLNNFRSTTSEVLNYGEKTRTPIVTSTIEAETEAIIEVVTELFKEEQPTNSDVEQENIQSNTELSTKETITGTEVETMGEKVEVKNYAEITTTPSSPEVVPNTNLDDFKNVGDDSESIYNENSQQENVAQSIKDEIEPLKEIKENVSESKESSNEADKSAETEDKVEVEIVSQVHSLDISDHNNTPEIVTSITETETTQTDTTTVSTTVSTTPSIRTRLPYKPRRKTFTPSTEASLPSSSKVFSRKYNPGAYTSPATADKPFRPSGVVTRRPFSSKIFTRRPFTPRTTQKIEEEYIDLEVLDESDEPEQDNPFVFVPANQLFTRKPDLNEDDDGSANSDELIEEGEGEENYEEEDQADEITPKVSLTTRTPGFKPRVVTSNTFRNSATRTTEQQKRPISLQNRTGIITRFSSNKPVGDGKTRVQNVPQGYNSPINTLKPKLIPRINKNETEESKILKENVTTISSVVDTETTTEDDDYLTYTSATLSDDKDFTTSDDTTTTDLFEVATATAELEIDDSTDDYLEATTDYPTTQAEYPVFRQTELAFKTSNVKTLPSSTEVAPTTETTTEQLTSTTTTTTTTTTTVSPPVSPVIKTQFNKLFSVSRVVEVNSKLDKHRVNKNNETTFIEEGKIVVEKRPVVDKIGEVSRYSLIKIVEDEIPIYLTKFGHVYPVENPPDNIIRIDEARNARALNENHEVPKESLVASESINEAYRHVKQLSDDDENKGHIEHLPSDEFLSYVNDEKKVDKDQNGSQYTQWQFVPAAYENEQAKAGLSYDIVTPRSMNTKQSTLSLEGLFKTDIPAMERKVSEQKSHPFVVYSGIVPSEDISSASKISDLKPEIGGSIITFAKGQEFKGDAIIEEALKNPIKITVLPQLDIHTMFTVPSTTSISESTTPSTIVTQKISSPIIDLLSTTQFEALSSKVSTTTALPTTTVSTSTSTTTIEASTTVNVPANSTTTKIAPVDTKRGKFGFPRRPLIKPSNFTRPPVVFRPAKKINATVLSNLNQKANKTTFSPSKSRFSVNRVQNVPVDLRKKANIPKAVSKSFTTTRTYTTESPKTTTERKLYFKPIRPNYRPSFTRKTTPSATTGNT